MFNFFRNNDDHDEEIEDDDVIASISYLIKRDAKTALIDVELHSYDSECVNGLCTILDVLGSDIFYVDTINIIRTSLIEQGREDLVKDILNKLELKLRQKIINSAKDRLKDEPCIKPSEMFR